MSRKIGAEAELWVANYLKQNGFKLLEKNWSSKRGEIDLIALKNEKIYFIEVKFRRSKSFGMGLESLTPSKLKKMAATALHYIQIKMKGQCDIAFAAAVIDLEASQNPLQFFEFPLDLGRNSYY